MGNRLQAPFCITGSKCHTCQDFQRLYLPHNASKGIASTSYFPISLPLPSATQVSHAANTDVMRTSLLNDNNLCVSTTARLQHFGLGVVSVSLCAWEVLLDDPVPVHNKVRILGLPFWAAGHPHGFWRPACSAVVHTRQPLASQHQHRCHWAG